MKKHDITTEDWREYVYADGLAYRIDKPRELYISDSGSHRVVDLTGVAHYPKSNWIAVRWNANPPVSF